MEVAQNLTDNRTSGPHSVLACLHSCRFSFYYRSIVGDRLLASLFVTMLKKCEEEAQVGMLVNLVLSLLEIFATQKACCLIMIESIMYELTVAYCSRITLEARGEEQSTRLHLHLSHSLSSNLGNYFHAHKRDFNTNGWNL